MLFSNPIKNYLVFYVFALFILSLFRVLLISLYSDRIDSLEQLIELLFWGVRFDVISISFLVIFVFSAHLLFSWSTSASMFFTRFSRYYLSVALGILVFTEMATPNFIEQYGVRPNVWFVEYLNRPVEVFQMLVKGYPFSLLVSLLFTVSSSVLLFRKLSLNGEQNTMHPVFSIFSCFFVFFLLALSIRGTLGIRPLAPSNAAISKDKLVNTLPLNSFYSAFYAAYQLWEESNKPKYYFKVEQEKLRTEVVNALQHKELLATNDIFQLTRQSHNVKEKRFNLVIVVEESLGAEFVGSLGGVNATPNLERIGKSGWWFNRLYATGTRSARGLEALTTGFPPTSSQSILKRSKSQKNFFTIASLLKSLGYSTGFTYGGDSSFDNMKGFFIANGFDEVFDQYDFDNPTFNATWGVSDEDLFNKVHDQLLTKSEKGSFFQLVFTTSNHTPFEYPKGRIKTIGDPQTATNAVRYADHALGKFFDKAKKSSYWENTIFVVVADHASRVRGRSLLPIDSFHIPGLIIGATIQPKVIDRLSSQLDILPTVLSLIGVKSEHPMIGTDLTRNDLDKIPERVMMQYADVQGYREGHSLVVLEYGKSPTQFEVQGSELVSSRVKNEVLINRAKAFSALPVFLYENQLYTHLSEKK